MWRKVRAVENKQPGLAGAAALLIILTLAAVGVAGERPRVLLLGDSLTQGGDWAGLLPEVQAVNQGISGETTAMILARLDRAAAVQPDLIFLQAGINDFGRSGPARYETVLNNHRRIWRELRAARPQARLFLISLFPVSERRFPGWNRAIANFNRDLRAQAEKEGLTYIDLHPLLTDEEGQLRPDLTYDGLHLQKEAYTLWAEALRPYLTEALEDERK